jgi:hypothetical protein
MSRNVYRHDFGKIVANGGWKIRIIKSSQRPAGHMVQKPLFCEDVAVALSPSVLPNKQKRKALNFHFTFSDEDNFVQEKNGFRALFACLKMFHFQMFFIVSLVFLIRGTLRRRT